MNTEAVDLSRKYFKLSAIIDHTLLTDLDLSIAHYFQKFLTSAKWYLSTLRTFHAQDVKTIMMDVSDVNTCQIPTDYVQWCKVGEKYGQYIRTLGVNASLSKDERTLGNPEFIYSGTPDQLPNGVDITNYGGYEFSNYGGRTLFSIGGGLPSKGFFTIVNREHGCREMLLDVGICSTQIYMEYIGIGFSPCDETICTPYEAEAVRKHIVHHWEKTRKDGGKTEAAIFRTGQELYHAEAIVKASKNDLDPDTLVAVTRKYYRLTNKI